MDAHILHALVLCHLQQTDQVVDMAVHSPIAEQAQQVQCMAVLSLIHGSQQHFVLFNAAIGNGMSDPGQALINDPAGADGHMANFRVAHLAFRQPYSLAAAQQPGVGIMGKVIIQIRCIGRGRRIRRTGRGYAPPVQNHQHYRFFPHN